MDRLKKIFQRKSSGMGTVEVILIIVVLIGIVLVFKEQINEMIESVMENFYPDGLNWDDTGL